MFIDFQEVFEALAPLTCGIFDGKRGLTSLTRISQPTAGETWSREFANISVKTYDAEKAIFAGQVTFRPSPGLALASLCFIWCFDDAVRL